MLGLFCLSNAAPHCCFTEHLLCHNYAGPFEGTTGPGALRLINYLHLLIHLV